MTVVDPEPAAAATPPADKPEWDARVRLRLAAGDGKTAVTEHTERGRMSIRPVPADGDTCRVAVSYPSNGIASGERTRLKVDVTDGGRAALTTSGPVRLRRSAGPVSLMDRQLTVSTSASLEWLPRESVVDHGAEADVSTRVILEEEARFLGWEIAAVPTVRPGTERRSGRLQQRFEVRRAGEALVNERVIVEDHAIRTSIGATGGSAIGTLVAVCPDGIAESVGDDLLRAIESPPLPGSVWQAPYALVVRIPAVTAERAVEDLLGVWRRLRPLVLGQPAGKNSPVQS